MNNHNTKCFMSHLGEYMIEIGHFNQIANMVLSNTVVVEANQGGIPVGELETHQTEAGTLIIPISGMLMRNASSMGGTSTTMVKKTLRNAMSDESVKAVLLHIDSPGGHVNGTDDVAQAVKAFGAHKPIFSHVDGNMASAAYWIGSGVHSVSASRMSSIGSLGTVLTVQDFSKKFEKEGITTHVISTGKFKGMGEPGSEITKDQLKFLQNRVNALNEFFMSAVQESRGMDSETVADLFDGSFMLAGEAISKGLIDEVKSFEQALADIEAMIAPDSKSDASASMRLRLHRQ